VALSRIVQTYPVLDKNTIRAGKKAPVPAAGIDVQARTQSADIIYMFSKTSAISVEDKDIEVVLRLGQIELKRKFSLKDMIYNGKLEL